MQAYEVRVVTEDGDLAESYNIQCADILEAHELLRDQHADAAVLLRALPNEPVS